MSRSSTSLFVQIVAVFVSTVFLNACADDSEIAERPNILVIVADDLGYTDLGMFGSEIATPNLDQLANAGMLLSNFHTAPTCSPTRAMLLTSTDHHLSGIGSMAAFMKAENPSLMTQAGYEGYLNFRVASLAELLSDSGYRTYMTGKWHLGLTEETSPTARGFQRSFALLEGGAGHLDDLSLNAGTAKAIYREDNKLVDLPDDFYSTRFYTEKMLAYLQEDQKSEKPFFAYLAYTAPHWPLQAPAESIMAQQGNYAAGYEVLFEQRLQGLKSKGFIAEDVFGSPLLARDEKWDDLSEAQQKISSRKMEIYAAMISDLDKYIGELIASLKEMGMYENTFILFMSDNGAEGENVEQRFGPKFSEGLRLCCDNSYSNMGNADSYLWPGSAWARASIGASRLYKGNTTEGGILAPAFVSHPGHIESAQRFNGFVSVLDIMPTLLNLAGVEHPGSNYKGRDVFPMQGSPMNSMLLGDTEEVHEEDYIMGWELHGNKGLRQGDWKIVSLVSQDGSEEWGLYNLKQNPAETQDLTENMPQKFQELKKLLDDYIHDNGVKSPRVQY